MGNDGGSIPKRRELVKDATRALTVSELKATALESLTHAWSHCALSGEPLDLSSVVSDWRGRLYNYESILRGLMSDEEQSAADTTLASLGIRSLRDVLKLRFAKNDGKWACPISIKEMGPATKAVYLVPCGHVFAEMAITKIPENICPECAERFQEENVVTIFPRTDKDIERAQSRVESLRAQGLTHTLKKDKSEKKKKRKAADQSTSGEAAVTTNKNSTSAALGFDKRVNGINNQAAASLTARVLAEQDERNKRRKMAEQPVRREAAT